jgi:hypothetical protein
MLAAIAIALGYATLFWALGWWGLLAAAVHIGIMLIALQRGG